MTLQPIVDRLERILAELAKVVQVSWATVTAIGPVKIRFDGETAPLDAAPQNPYTGLTIGQRVLCLKLHRRVVIVARSSIAMQPTPLALASGIAVFNGLTPVMYVRDGKLVLEGAVARTSGTFSTTYVDVLAPGAIPDLPGIRDEYRSVRILPSAGGSPPLRAFIAPDGGMRAATTSGTANYLLLNSEHFIN